MFDSLRGASLCSSLMEAKESEAQGLRLVQLWAADNGLTLHPEKTRIVDSRTESFAF
jgi:hypothetical protein